MLVIADLGESGEVLEIRSTVQHAMGLAAPSLPDPRRRDDPCFKGQPNQRKPLFEMPSATRDFEEND